MQKWEYRFVSAEWRVDEWCVLSVNGQQLGDWKADETIYAYANRIGEEGWDLVAAPYTADAFHNHRPRLVFKRPKA